jgi:hypothetical protein
MIDIIRNELSSLDDCCAAMIQADLDLNQRVGPPFLPADPFLPSANIIGGGATVYSPCAQEEVSGGPQNPVA